MRITATLLLALISLCSPSEAAEFPGELATTAMNAIDASDEARLAELLAADFVAIRGRGELVPHDAFLADLRSLRDAKRFAGLRRDWRDVKVHSSDEAATFVARSTWVPVDPQSTGRATGSALVTQQWRMTERGWRLTLLQTTRLGLAPDVHTFPSGELQLKGMFFAPSGQGPFPAIVYAHGNEPDPSDLCESVAPPLVSRGYVVWCPHRRGSGLSAGQGENLLRRLTDVERREGVEARSRLAIAQLEGAHLDDVTASVAYVKTLPLVARERVFLIGNSFGGVLALLAAERDIGVAAVADFAGGALNWDRSAPFRERLQRAASSAKVPVFLGQAANDFSTGPTTELGEALAAAGKPHRAVVYPAFGLTRGEGHGLGVDGVDVWAADVLPFLEAAVRKR